MSKTNSSPIEAAKQAGHRVFKVTLSGDTYIYRDVLRKEFKDVQTAIFQRAAQDPDDIMSGRSDHEDELVARALIEPQLTSKLELSAVPAGVVTQLFELIMKASGFQEEPVEPEQL